MFTSPLKSAAATVIAAACLTGAAFASDLPTPEGDVILTISGEIGVTNADGAAVFDIDGLKTLPVSEFKTSTIWTEGAVTFTGVQLSELLDAVGVQGTVLKATAINDYAIDFSVEEANEDYALIAYEMDGAPMSVREKGPLWLVFPYDSKTKYQSEVYYSRSIWQLDRIEILSE